MPHEEEDDWWATTAHDWPASSLVMQQLGGVRTTRSMGRRDNLFFSVFIF